jgi:amidase
VRNPYVLDRNPCGSSSGSGVAVADNLAAAAVGTETDGSIVCPSAVNGIVGIKPTVGLISRAGIIPISASQDTAGPMTRTVTDAALLLGAMTGVDTRDPRTKASASRIRDYRASLDATALKGARIGVARQRFFGYSPAADKLIDAAIDELRRQGATIVDPANMATAGKFDDCEFEILLYEFKAGLNTYLKGLGPDMKVRSLKELIAFNERERDREMPHFGQEILEMADKKGSLTSAAYKRAVTTCKALSRTKGLDAVLAAHKLDAMIAPTLSPAWPIDHVNGDHFLGASSTPAAVHGPALVGGPPDCLGIRLRTGDAPPPPTAVPADVARSVGAGVLLLLIFLQVLVVPAEDAMLEVDRFGIAVRRPVSAIDVPHPLDLLPEPPHRVIHLA